MNRRRSAYHGAQSISHQFLGKPWWSEQRWPSLILLKK